MIGAVEFVLTTGKLALQADGAVVAHHLYAGYRRVATYGPDADARGYAGGTHAAGFVVLGARVPIVLASRADEAANEQGALRISPADAMPSVWVIPTDEERMIAMHTARLV